MITRSKMRRQLYRGGGIANLIRQKYGLGDFVRKLIPNELADIAVKTAPFVAPFNPGIAGLMRGIGRYDQRGSLSDALKQGLATTAFGAGTRYLGGASPMGGGLTGGFTRPIQPGGPISRMWGAIKPPVSEKAAVKTITDAGITADAAPVTSKIQGPISKILYGTAGDAASKGAIGAGGEFAMGKAFGKGIPAVYAGSTLAALAVQKAMGDVGGREPGESLTAFNKRRENTVSQYLEYYFKRANKFRIAPEDMDEAAAKFVRQNTTEYRTGENQGGRVGLKHGTPEMGIKSLEAGAPDITYEGNEGPQAPQEEQQMADALLRDEYDKYVYDLLEQRPEATPMSFEEFKMMVIAEGKMSGGQPLPEDPTKPINPFAPKPTGPVLPDKMMAAKGGRIGYRMGTDPRALMGAPGLAGMQSAPRPAMDPRGLRGLPGIPRMAPDGMEFDMRENGGFQGLGAKEGKDDVPAMLAKNEFVFTADAVRGAGGGDIELGAQRMYDTMKNLEKRVV